jgi:hypothetical protein
MTVASGNNGSAEMAQASGSPTDENRLQQLLRLAKASTKMVLELEKATPASALIGIWECTAKDARAEYIRAATRAGRSLVEIAARLGKSTPDIAAQLEESL